MHVLRAEKGFAIVGQETDGTVTPQDLGMSWIVSKRKPDYVGKRSHSRPDAVRPDRKRLVGLLAEDPTAFVEEGAQIVAGTAAPMLGHVTSSYTSAVLARTFSLAMVRGVVLGDKVNAVGGDGVPVPMTVVDSVFYDPQNLRRDGDPVTEAFAGSIDLESHSPAGGFAGRFAEAGSSRVRLREIADLPTWEVRGEDPGQGLRLGPAWWLVVGREESEAGKGWVDVSGQRTVLELSGPGAREVLLTGCPIDLHPEVFTGHTSTLLAKAQVVLERTEADVYRVHVRSSFAHYLAEWLLDAVQGLRETSG